jgi:anti-sigma factor RsiW
MTEQPGAGRLDPETLAAYVDGLLPPEERAKVDAEIAADPESYEWLVSTISAVDDETIVATAQVPSRDSGPASAGESPVPAAPALVPGAAPTPQATGGTAAPGRVLPFHRRRVVQGMVGTLLAAAAALVLVVRSQPVWWQGIWGPAVDPRFAQLVAAVGEERYIEARLTGGFKYGPLRPLTRGATSGSGANLELSAAVLELQSAAARTPTASSLHAWGVGQLLLGDFDGAIASLSQAAALDSRARVDLAAALATRGQWRRDPGDLTEALRQLELAQTNGDLPTEGLYNRALVLQQLGETQRASRDWQAVGAIDPAPDWARDARARAMALRKTGAPK